MGRASDLDDPKVLEDFAQLSLPIAGLTSLPIDSDEQGFGPAVL